MSSSNTKEHQSHQNNLGENEDPKAQGCSSSGHRGGDAQTSDEKRRRSREPQEEEEARRVLQRVSSFDASTMGICDMDVTENTTQARELCDHKQPVFGNLSKHDVFLNHRGPDLKKTFVSHLAAALRRAGRDPFLDAKSLVKGQHAENSITEALSGVYVHIAIFSPGYAESKYCLNELCDMLKSKKPLIPVFYNVEPENLRWIEGGPFAKAFEEHVKKGRNEEVVRWRAALFQAAAITGFRLVDCDNDTSKLEEKIVIGVLNALPVPFPLPVARHPVNLNESSTYVINHLTKMGDKVGVVGIYGVGGIGKTTLAREVYYRVQSSFPSRCFLKDVKDAKGIAFTDLQMKMVTNLLRMDIKELDWDFARCFEEIQKKKILLVIDDINKRQQFDELIPDLKMLASRSLVLITSRELDILRSIMLDISEGFLYQVPQLSFEKSLDLFLWCAFRKNNITLVDASFHKWMEEITSACCGLPLALEVMGGFLADKRSLPEDEKYWKEAIFALRRNGDIITSLQIRYNGLTNDEDKNMFLDIACFVLGHSKKVAMEVWESSGDYAAANWSLCRLINKCLVKVDGYGNLTLHDLLRDMGRNVVIQRALNKVERQSHIWDSSMATKILQKRQGSTELLTLSILGVDRDIACKAEQYAKLVALRCLLLDDYKVTGDFSRWSEELRWLQWRHCPHEELPLSLELPNLVVLDLANSYSLTRLWAKNFELQYPLRELQILVLNNCPNLKELPQHLNKLLKLKSLNLKHCSSLTILPESFGQLQCLIEVDFQYCNGLQSLCESFSHLSNLENLNLFGCDQLKKLPHFGKLGKLKVLDLQLTGLKELPEGFGQLQNLGEELDFSRFTKFRSLCEDFGCLTNLRKLCLMGCHNLIQLPESFSHLSNLENLNLFGCTQLQKLPHSFGKLGKLKMLDLRMTGLKELPEDFGQLQNLGEELDFSGFTKLRSLCEDFGCLSNLRKLNLQDCCSLIQLPESLSRMSNLEYLNLCGCTQLEKLPRSIGRLEKLKVLDLRLTGLKELPEGFGQLQSLGEELDFYRCSVLQRLCEDFDCFVNLRRLKLEACCSLIQLPESLSNLSNLENLDLHGCMQLQKLPDSFGRLRKLKVLDLRLTGLKELPEGFGQLQSLSEELDLYSCTQLQSLCEDFGSLSNLRKLRLENCSSLTQLPESFSQLSSLECLNLRGCRQLQNLPPLLDWLRKLKVLDLRLTG